MSDIISSKGELAPPPVREVLARRVEQETQARVAIAQRFPRDEVAALERIRQSCMRSTLAEQAIYSYKRGTSKIEGPTIRLLEAIAQAWGNLTFGVEEIERREGESVARAYCWDLQNNNIDEKIFTVRHVRNTKEGSYLLVDDRDIYEHLANFAARRKRACMEAVIPDDVAQQAVAWCNETLKKANKDKPLAQRLQAALEKFAPLGVTAEMVANRLGHNLDACTEVEVIQLGKIYNSLRDGMATVKDFFDPPQVGSGLKEKLAEADPPSEDPAE